MSLFTRRKKIWIWIGSYISLSHLIQKELICRSMIARWIWPRLCRGGPASLLAAALFFERILAAFFLGFCSGCCSCPGQLLTSRGRANGPNYSWLLCAQAGRLHSCGPTRQAACARLLPASRKAKGKKESFLSVTSTIFYSLFRTYWSQSFFGSNGAWTSTLPHPGLQMLRILSVRIDFEFV